MILYDFDVMGKKLSARLACGWFIVGICMIWIGCGHLGWV